MKVQPISGSKTVMLWCPKCERMTRHTCEVKPRRCTCHVCRITLGPRQRGNAERARQRPLFS